MSQIGSPTTNAGQNAASISVDQQRNQLLAAIQQILTTLAQSGALSISNTPPPTDTSPGVAGAIAYDSTHLYICVAASTWRRVVVTTF